MKTTIGGAEVVLALAAVMTGETTITKGAGNPVVVGGEEKEVIMMRKTAAMVTMVVAVTDTTEIENISGAVERGANHPHRGTIDHRIVIANVRKGRKGVNTAEIIPLPATIAAVMVVRIATAEAAAARPPPPQDTVPNVVKNHTKNHHPKSPPLTNNQPPQNTTITIPCK